MKEFSIELAKASKPVCTRDGRKARIVCYDVKGDYPILALIERSNVEEGVYTYNINGHFLPNREHYNDLIIAPEKHEGWVNIYHDENSVTFAGERIYDSKKEAIANMVEHSYIATIKIEWEE